MNDQKVSDSRITLRNLTFTFMVASGVIAAYLMMRRGVPITQVAQNALTNPVGSLVSELDPT